MLAVARARCGSSRGEDVAVDEVAGATADRAAIGVLGGDAVVHHQATGAHRVVQLLEVEAQVGMADVFEHADADHLVETAVARQVAVVEQLQGDLVFQAFGLDPLAPQLELFLAEGDAVDLDAELTRRQARQTTPAAADVEQALARLQAQLAAQVAQLGLLRGRWSSLPVSK
jgi:hypothetical protein